jgi:large repetitive protein
LNTGTGAIAGTPTAAGTFNFTIGATDSLGAAGTRGYSIVVNAALVIAPTSLPAGAVGAAYSQTLSVTGGTGAASFGVTAGSLPAGLTLNAGSGVLSGTPSAFGVFNFTVTATDTVSASAVQAYALTINGAGVAVNPASLPNAVVGTAYSQAISATGGNGSYTYAVTAGALPAGLSLNAASGLLSGTPTTAATSNFTVTATDGLGATGARAYSIQVFAAMTVNPTILPVGNVGVAYSQTISVTGGAGGVTYAMTAGALPGGLTLNGASGILAGTPTANGVFNFTITATDGLGAIATRAYAVMINQAMVLNPPTLPAASLGSAYSVALTVSGGSGTNSFALSGGTLPAGIALDAATGVLSGTPTATGTFNFTATATDSLGVTAARSYVLAVNAPVALGPVTLPNPTVGTAYSQNVVGSGGDGTYTFSVSAGAMPTGLVLNTATGAIGGTPTAAGTFNFTVTATDGVGASGSRAYTVTVAASALTLGAAVPNGAVGAAYSGALQIVGGTAPYTFAVTSGSLPPGLTLDAGTGELRGVPTADGSYSFVITVTDVNGASGSFTILLEVVARPDPSQDPAVRDLHAAQVASAARFGAAQIGNIGSRLQMLHLGHDPCEVRFDISANIRWERTADADKAKADANNPAAQRKAGCDRPMAFWAGGNVDFGFLRPSTATDRSDFRTEGLTFGADMKLGQGLVVGAALGYGRDQSDADGFGSESRSNAQSVALYGSYQPMKSVFVDAVAGYGSLSYDLNRWQADDRALLAAERKGSQWFMSLGATASLQWQGIKFMPYARIDRVQSRLGAYAESGTSALRLAYDATSFAEDTLAAGLYTGLSFKAWGIGIEPGLRVEQRRVRTSSAEQNLAYWDMPSSSYTLNQAADSESRTNGTLSLMLRFGLGTSLGLEYSYTGGRGTYRNENARATLRAPF